MNPREGGFILPCWHCASIMTRKAADHPTQKFGDQEADEGE